MLRAVEQKAEHIGRQSGTSNRPREHEVRIAGRPKDIDGGVDRSLRRGDQRRSGVGRLTWLTFGAEVRELLAIEL
jgi:hypothetical protein